MMLMLAAVQDPSRPMLGHSLPVNSAPPLEGNSSLHAHAAIRMRISTGEAYYRVRPVRSRKRQAKEQNGAKLQCVYDNNQQGRGKWCEMQMTCERGPNSDNTTDASKAETEISQERGACTNIMLFMSGLGNHTYNLGRSEAVKQQFGYIETRVRSREATTNKVRQVKLSRRCPPLASLALLVRSANTPAPNRVLQSEIKSCHVRGRRS